MRLDIRPITCRSALNHVRGMPFKWSLNPYRGCSHACWYCYARETHTYFDLNGGRDFERIIFAKLNVTERLRVQLGAPRWRRDLVAVGTATDPHQPVEGHLRLTQACLGEFIQGRTPISLITKSTLIRRDRDLLLDVARAAGATITVSVPILDAHVSRMIEPGTPAPRERLRVVRELSDLGLNVGVNLAPILPGLTDSKLAIERLIAAAHDHGARYVGAVVLHLKPEPRRWFMAQIRRLFPQLETLYTDLYPAGFAYPARDLADSLHARVKQAKAVSAWGGDAQPVGPPPVPAQLALEL